MQEEIQHFVVAHLQLDVAAALQTRPSQQPGFIRQQGHARCREDPGSKIEPTPNSCSVTFHQRDKVISGGNDSLFGGSSHLALFVELDRVSISQAFFPGKKETRLFLRSKLLWALVNLCMCVCVCEESKLFCGPTVARWPTWYL